MNLIPTSLQLPSHHPLLQLLWNYWPFSILFLTPLRLLLNFLLSPLNFFVWWIPLLWNLIMETICFMFLTFGSVVILTAVGSIFGTMVACAIAIAYGFLCVTVPT